MFLSVSIKMSDNFKQLIDYLKYVYFAAVLTSWQERFPCEATYPCLARALMHPAVGRVDLAVKYCGLQFGKDLPMAKDY